MCIETKPHQLRLQASFDHCRERWNICGGKNYFQMRLEITILLLLNSGDEAIKLHSVSNRITCKAEWQ
jgi:hypothetical protein